MQPFLHNYIMKIIISRYNENIEWTKSLPNVIIYNKGPQLPSEYNNEIYLPNVGREGHTYLTYIYNNYDNLDDYTIFLQGNPFDHSPNLLRTLEKYINNKKLNIDFEYISELIIDCKLSGCIYDPTLPLKKVYEKMFNERKETLNFKFGAGAQFIVSKDKIRSRSKEFYFNILKMLDNKVGPKEGWVLERFWKLIFS